MRNVATMKSFPEYSAIRELIELARREDLGEGDVTSRLLVRDEQVAVGTIVQREVGVACGLPIVPMVCRAYDERLRVELIPGFHLELIEGRYSDARSTPLVRVRGPLRSILEVERVLLNFLQHMSGVATATQRFVRRVQGTGAAIYDTRKTIPGLRLLDKYAVRKGGGMNHRTGLYDMVLVKDNHIAGTAVRDLAAVLTAAVSKSRAENRDRPIEIEVDSLDQLHEVLKVEGVDLILLDNMDCPGMKSAVEMRDRAGKKGKVALEASGGVTLETVHSIALTGVERISVGAITHSAAALDIGLDIET